MSATSERPGSETTLSKFRWPLAVTVVVLMASFGLAGFVISIKKLRQRVPSQTIDSIGTQAAKLLEKFDQRNITRTFEESLPQLSSEPGGRLELAALTMNENLSESNNLITGLGQARFGQHGHRD